MSIINKFFDKVYVVTCKKLEKRHEYIKKHFRERNIEFEFIYGPSVESLNLSEYNLSKKFSNIKKCNYQLCILLTHKLVWDKIIENNYEKCLICEDDVFFPDFFEKEFTDFSKNLTNINWDLLQLGWQPHNFVWDKDKILNKFVKKNWCFIGGAHCYGVNIKAIQTLLSTVTWFKKNVSDNDNNFFRKKQIHKTIDGYIGDLTTPHMKNQHKIYLYCYSPIKCLAFDCSHGNKHTNIKFGRSEKKY